MLIPKGKDFLFYLGNIYLTGFFLETHSFTILLFSEKLDNKINYNI
jgi:hypothetical protein